MCGYYRLSCMAVLLHFFFFVRIKRPKKRIFLIGTYKMIHNRWEDIKGMFLMLYHEHHSHGYLYISLFPSFLTITIIKGSDKDCGARYRWILVHKNLFGNTAPWFQYSSSIGVVYIAFDPTNCYTGITYVYICIQIHIHLATTTSSTTNRLATNILILRITHLL